MPSKQCVYVIIVNWNGWQDTLECLESLLRIDHPRLRIVICDNGSKDGSVEHIRDWAEGRLDATHSANQQLRHLTFPPVPKPVAYMEYDRSEAEHGGRSDDVGARVILVRASGNLGFAGGSNVGLRYALSRDDLDYAWLLNNDTVVKPDALDHMLRRMSNKPDAGICGATLLYYDDPVKVQSLGGARYNKWLGSARHIGLFAHAENSVSEADVERCMDYVVGASMLVSKAFLQEIGLLDEEYFLYFEELDWAMRARGRFSLAYASGSIVYHKEGRSTGATNCRPDEKSAMADLYQIRNRVVVTRKFFPWALPTVYLGLLLTIANRIRRGQWDMVRTLIRNRCFIC